MFTAQIGLATEQGPCCQKQTHRRGHSKLITTKLPESQGNNKDLIITSCPLGFSPTSDKLGIFQLNYQPKEQQDLIIKLYTVYSLKI